MRSPQVEARMKHRDVLARLWVSHKQAMALAQGAGDAGQCPIFQCRVSTGDDRQDMVDVESRLLTRLSEAAILAAIPCPLDHLPPQAGRNDHCATSVPNSSAPTASARLRVTPPNPPTPRPRFAPHRSVASPHPACQVTPSAAAEPPLVVATLRGHQVLR